MSPRRQYTHQPRCAEKGCPERALYTFDRQADYRSHIQREAKHPYRCTRHNGHGGLLTLDNPEVTTVAVATPPDWSTERLFWHDGKSPGSGFAHGLGFKVFAEDFPAGTRLVVTARIEPPLDGRESREAGA